MGQSNGNHEHLGRGEGRGDPRRVADVHAQTRRGLTQAAVFLAAAVAAALAGIGEGWWLPLHLFVVGSLLSAISAGALMLSVTWSAAPAPRPAIATSQRGLLAAGAVGLVVGRELGWTQLFVAGGAAVIASMLGLVVMLLRVRREAVTARFAPAIEGYVVAVAAGSAGMVMGILVIAGPAQTRLADLRAAHLTLNLFGLVGLVVAGTLPFFAATQVRARMSRRATPRAMRASLAVLVAAVTITTAGHLISRSSIVAIGLLQYSLALVAVATMLPIYSTRRMAWAGPRVWQLATGVGWWIAMTVALAVATLRGVDDRPVLQALVIGGYAQILVASLAYLGPVARGGGAPATHRRIRNHSLVGVARRRQRCRPRRSGPTGCRPRRHTVGLAHRRDVPCNATEVVRRRSRGHVTSEAPSPAAASRCDRQRVRDRHPNSEGGRMSQGLASPA